MDSRSPHGERGLKLIEPLWVVRFLRRSPHGERGLKSNHIAFVINIGSRSPHGERGLKYNEGIVSNSNHLSLPAWGAWIEIQLVFTFNMVHYVAPRMGSVD